MDAEQFKSLEKLADKLLSPQERASANMLASACSALNLDLDQVQDIAAGVSAVKNMPTKQLGLVMLGLLPFMEPTTYRSFAKVVNDLADRFEAIQKEG